MKFLVKFQLKPGNKMAIMETFELRGPNRHPGVSLQGAWIATNEETIYVLAESTDEGRLAAAAQAWGEFGDYQVTPVIDLEQY